MLRVRKFFTCRLRSVSTAGIVGRAFHAAIPASVVIGSIAVAFAVFFVVLVVVRDEVVQRKAVVAGYEVDTLLGFAFFVTIDAWASEKPVGHASDRMLCSAEEVADIIAKSAVPLLPAVSDETAHLIQAGRIPGLGDHLRAGERRIGFDVPQHRRVGHDMTRRIARKDRCKVEPETIHVHLLNPVTKAVDDHAADDRMIGVQGIAGAGEI